MRFSIVSVLVGYLVAGCGGRDKTSQQFVGTWQHDSRSGISLTILADGSFITRFESTNHTVVMTFQGTWRVKDRMFKNRELIMTVTNVAGSIPHEPVGSIDRLRIIELDSLHMTFACAISNYVATETFVRRP